MAPVGIGSLERMSSKSDRRAAQETVAAYHEAQLAGLIELVGGAVDRFRAGEVDAFDVDRVVFQFSRAAKELWTFYNYSDVMLTAQNISERASTGWWERAAPRQH
jgi:hypothetical protein